RARADPRQPRPDNGYNKPTILFEFLPPRGWGRAGRKPF
ncbi:hypothetical protein F443_22949, partial [Phytophthora nicotianae P1569]